MKQQRAVASLQKPSSYSSVDLVHNCDLEMLDCQHTHTQGANGNPASPPSFNLFLCSHLLLQSIIWAVKNIYEASPNVYCPTLCDLITDNGFNQRTKNWNIHTYIHKIVQLYFCHAIVVSSFSVTVVMIISLCLLYSQNHPPFFN